MHESREERDVEARAFGLAARGAVSEAVFEEEVGLIRTKQRWITEQQERVQGQLADLERYRFDPEVVGLMRERLETRLDGASPEDRRFVLEAINAKAIVQADKTWELEVQVPREAPAHEELQIVNTRPGSNYTVNTDFRWFKNAHGSALAHFPLPDIRQMTWPRATAFANIEP